MPSLPPGFCIWVQTLHLYGMLWKFVLDQHICPLTAVGQNLKNECALMRLKTLENTSRVSFDQDSLGSPSLYHFEQQWQFIRISNDADKRKSSDLSLILFCLLHPWQPIIPKNEELTLHLETSFNYTDNIEFSIIYLNYNSIMKRRTINDKDHL